jgi:plasmid maintenance system antidote protein VapI
MRSNAMNLRLKARIIELFGTQSDFALTIGADESVVSKIVRGRRTLTAEDQKRWAEVLQTSPEKIFGE